MPEFTNIKEAFKWWIENVYPELKPEEKESIRFFKHKFLNNKPLSGDKMLDIMEKLSSATIKVNLP